MGFGALELVMLYRVVRSISRSYFYVMFGVYVLAFVVAFALMFIPVVTIALLLLSLYSLVFVVAIGKGLDRLERALGAGALREGRCPACRGTIQRAGTIDQCESCGLHFGDEEEPAPVEGGAMSESP